MVPNSLAGDIIDVMVLTLPISPRVEAGLAAKAKAAGVDMQKYVADLVEQTAMAPLSIKEISGEIADDFARSGMSDDEFGDLLEEVKHEMRAEKRSRKTS
jgi:hypothetical protein